MALFAVAVLAAAALHFMTPGERLRLARAAAARLREAIAAVRKGRPPHDALEELLLTRTPRVLVTPLLIAVCVFVWLAARPADGAVLTAWGASYAPRTTHGEWWRLLTY